METTGDIEPFLETDTLVGACPVGASKWTHPADRFMDHARRGASLRKNRDSPTPGQSGYPCIYDMDESN